MTSIEDRLRAATLAAAATVPDGAAPPLRLPARRAGRIRGLSRLRGRLLTVAAPVAAAAAAAGVIAGAVVAHGHDGTGAPPPPGAVAAPRVPPPYLVALHYPGTYKGWKIQRADAVIASTATGRVLATVPVPRGYNAFVAVTGAYDDRTFVLAAQKLSRDSQGGGRRRPRQLFPATRLYRLHFAVTSHGSVAGYQLSTLSGGLLPPATFGDMALSPDGTRLAVDQRWTQPGTLRVGLRLYNLVTGAVRSWPLVTPPSEGTGGYPIDIITSPSWEDSGRLLALSVSSGKCQFCVRLLDTGGRGTTVQAASRVIARSLNLHASYTDWNSSLIAPDGRRVLRTVIDCVPTSKNSCYVVSRIYRYDANGRVAWILTDRVRDMDWDLLWSGPDARSFIVSSLAEGDGPPFISAARYAGGHWSPLRLPAQTLTAAW